MFDFLSRRTMKGEKVMMGSNIKASMSVSSVLRLVLRFLQFVMGIVVIGLYAQDLNRAHKEHKYADSKWVYATFCGAFGSLAALVFMLPLIKAWFFFAVDAVLFILFMTLFAIFGNMYIKENPEGDSGITRMKHAVWIDLVNMLLWFFTACYGGFIFYKWRTGRTTLTGRAENYA